MDESSPYVLKRAEELWFKDGNIVLRAEDAIFRVHKGILAANSSVFHTMLELPQSAINHEEMYEEFPLIHMSDSAYELREFLKAMCLNSIEVQIKSDFCALAAILRLSTKYDVFPLRSRAISAITPLYPTTLAEFHQRRVIEDKLPAWSFTGRPIAILALAEECRIPSVVPAALFGLTTHPSACFFDDLVVPGPAGSRFRLSHAQLRTVVLGRDRLLQAIREGPMRFLATFSAAPLCGTRACKNAFTIQLQEGWENVPGTHPAFQPEAVPWARLSSDGACLSCLKYVRREHRQGQEALWDRLPELFGLGSWDAVRSESG